MNWDKDSLILLMQYIVRSSRPVLNKIAAMTRIAIE